MTNERKQIEGEIEKWATKLLELNAEKRKLWLRRDGLIKGIAKREVAIKALVEGDSQAKIDLNELDKETMTLTAKITSLDIARKEAQRRMDNARKELAVFEYPESRKEGLKLKNRISKWIDEWGKIEEELSLAQNKANEIRHLTGQLPFEVMNTPFVGERVEDIRQWWDHPSVYIGAEEILKKEEEVE